ncbi:hypothetical protein QLQ15_04080 [Lysobacter sp. LF1]|uniref:Uncharacterized protein n=1 Tax=Lysobacter stagni TaxID=3045172 RepID=A0ABT6XDV1_9GAMM|nr:hypothetical protein [Lysobacter sp. LF1]MDI9238085.1 hypothetical protein [Lysobacter sp. LF1]
MATTGSIVVGRPLARSSAVLIDAAEVIALVFLLLPAAWSNTWVHKAGHALARRACHMQPAA